MFWQGILRMFYRKDNGIVSLSGVGFSRYDRREQKGGVVGLVDCFVEKLNFNLVLVGKGRVVWERGGRWSVRVQFRQEIEDKGKESKRQREREGEESVNVRIVIKLEKIGRGGGRYQELGWDGGERKGIFFFLFDFRF